MASYTTPRGTTPPLGAQLTVHLYGARIIRNKQVVAQETVPLESESLGEADGTNVCRFDFGLDAVGV